MNFKLVPIEPTDEMLQPACQKHTPGQPMNANHQRSNHECPSFDARRRIWASMVNAAPMSPNRGLETQPPLDLSELERLIREAGKKYAAWWLRDPHSPTERDASMEAREVAYQEFNRLIRLAAGAPT